jgi:protein gp37
MSTGIEWTEETWNPTTGCDRVSEGCDNCYALRLAARLKAAGNPRYQVDGDPRRSGPGFGLTLHWDKLEEPLRWRRPRTIFVDSMSDLFHKAVSEEFIEAVFETMSRGRQHQFQVLTKRPARMASIVQRIRPDPLPNVWLGTSVETQKWADVRIPYLLRTPAAVRFLSCEPLLGVVDLLTPGWLDCHNSATNVLDHESADPRIDWVIAGGESGPNARHMHPDWVCSLRDQCQSAAVPFFFKQWGGRTPKAGGRELDGRQWDEMPTSSGDLSTSAAALL